MSNKKKEPPLLLLKTGAVVRIEKFMHQMYHGVWRVMYQSNRPASCLAKAREDGYYQEVTQKEFKTMWGGGNEETTTT